MDIKKSFGERIKELRTMKGITQGKLSEMIGVSKTTLSGYENGNNKNPSLDILVRISDKCDVSIDWLAGISDVPDKNTSNKSATQLQTYSDLMKLMFLIGDSELETQKYLTYEIDNKTAGFLNSTEYYGVGIADPVVKFLLQIWQSTSTLFEQGTIDSTIYSAWKEKILRDFDVTFFGPFDSMYLENEIQSLWGARDLSTDYDRMLKATQNIATQNMVHDPEKD